VLTVQHELFGWPLRNALQRVAEEGAGVVVLLRKPESAREIVQQVVALGKAPVEDSADENQVLRTYGVGAQILSDLGVRRMRVLSAPKKMQAISGFGLEVVEYVACD
jgi:3,4-dihydroxy 2-butanone 4-phosphate synthase / GTP cyclohydrolase II